MCVVNEIELEKERCRNTTSGNVTSGYFSTLFSLVFRKSFGRNGVAVITVVGSFICIIENVISNCELFPRKLILQYIGLSEQNRTLGSMMLLLPVLLIRLTTSS